MPIVSVIIPVYNVEKYLRQCLDSVVNQTLKDIEIICVNDGSPDNCGNIIDEYAKRDNRIVAIHKENGGYASAINKGIEIAKGEFIGIVESDDYCATDMYEELYNKIKNSDADLVTGNFYYLKGNKNKTKEYSYCGLLNLDNNGSFNLKSSPNVLVKVAYPWKSLYRKSFLDKNNIRMLQDGQGAYEDQPWNITVLSKAKKILTLDKPIYYYRIDAAGSSTNNGTRKIINYLKRRAQGKDILIENGLFEGDILEYYYLAALNGGRTFMRTIAKEFKEEYYNVYKELLLPAYEEGLTFKYFPNKKKRRFERIIKYDYNKYKNTYYLYEFLGFIKDIINKNSVNFGVERYHADVNISPVRTIHICFSTDDKYVQHCVVAIKSILMNCDNTSNLSFHILDGGISLKRKKIIEKLKLYRDFDITYYNMSQFDFSKLPLNRDYISVATYYRLYLPEIISKDIKKMLYLDCDIIVEQDLKNIWDTNLDGYYAGVVEDEGSLTQIKRLGLPEENNYFNAGVILFNLKLIRNFDLLKKSLQYYSDNEEKIILQDQDILNGVFNDKCTYLSLAWNANGRLYLGNTLEHFYSDTDAQIARNNPCILHYTDRQKPWLLSSNHPLQSEYWKYLKKTPYKIHYFKYFIYKLLTNILGIKKYKNAYERYIKLFHIKIYRRTFVNNIKSKYLFGIKFYEKNINI